jgi:hypothetical protein
MFDFLTFMLTLFSYGLMFIGGVWLLLTAFFESFGAGLFYIFIPFYNIYFIITRWRETRLAFFTFLAGLALFFANFGILALTNIE